MPTGVKTPQKGLKGIWKPFANHNPQMTSVSDLALSGERNINDVQGTG